MRRAWVLEVGNLRKNEIRTKIALSSSMAQSLLKKEIEILVEELIEAGEYKPELYKVNDNYYRFEDYIYVSLEETEVLT